MAEAAAGSSSSPIPPSSTLYSYDVFLSFRGEDTRFNFTDHLHNALYEKGINTFIDDELRRGEEISPALVQAIKESRVSIIVFSQNYASSRWCLEELVEILECRKSKGQEVRPVFYKVDPSDVRNQRGAFGEAFATLDQCKYKESMNKWRAALKETADLSGWPVRDGESEVNIIKKIVGELSAQVLIPSCLLEVAAHPIGLESSRQDVTKLLRVDEENNVRMVGIWGPGGIGKTTIAKAVFNSISHKFEGSCFLADVRSKSISDSIAQLQETLLSSILRDPALKVNSQHQGVTFIKTRMQRKKVLLILDDVSDSSQLEGLAPSSDCFGSGSRIIITTRDKHWLTAHRVDEVYEVKMLDDDQSLELFSLHAFKQNEPLENYLKLAHRAVRYAGGLPLALAVLGSHLFCRSIDEWEATLDGCQVGDPQKKIRNILKLSYYALGKALQRDFIDIACFHKGKYVHEVKTILEACYDLKSGTVGITQLQQKALIRIERDMSIGSLGDRIQMHDLIEDMGKDIVYEESPNEPEKRSRLWCEDDVDHVMTNNTGTNNIKGIQFGFSSVKDWNNAKSFSVMKKLRYLSIKGLICGESEVDYHFQELRCLDLPGCLLHSFPSGFHANKLVKLNIHYSYPITRLWDGGQIFSRLTSMNLSHCWSLAQLPDFSRIPNLKELYLSFCHSLVKVLDSVGFLDKLVTLRVHKCSKLIRLPRIINLKSAKSISITGCLKLEEFSEVGDEMCSLTSLDLSMTGIRELHPSIAKLIGLEELNLSDCKNLTSLLCSIYGLQHLKKLNLTRCSKLVRFPTNTNILNDDGCSLSLPNLKELDLRGCTSLSDSDFLMILDCCQTLEMLDLSETNVVSLPACIIGQIFSRLTSMNLSRCNSLAQLPDFSRIPNLKELDLSYCRSLVEVPDSVGFLDKLVTLRVYNCSKLIRLPRIINLKSAKSISITECFKLEEFSEVGDEMCSLTSLDLSCTGIRELHPSITKLIGLEELDLSYCNSLVEVPITRLWDGGQIFSRLTSMNLSRCDSLAQLPDFSRIPNLKELDLSCCSSLVEVPDSVGFLDKLVTLRVYRCYKLIRLPRIINLKSAKSISITQCYKLEEFSEVGDEMCSLTSLDLSDTGIRELHPSIAKLIGLEKLYISDLVEVPDSVRFLDKLVILRVFQCAKLIRLPRIINLKSA